MSVNICIDWGNTNVKAAIFADKKMQKQFSFAADVAGEHIASLLETHKPEKAIISAVVPDTANVVDLLRSKIVTTVVVTGSTPVPINNAYLSPETLGPDRLALVTGAHFHYADKNNLVISIGTCITYNFVQKTKTFRGGAISPGMHMRFRAMHEYTGMLPQISKIDEEPLMLGYDTDTCLQSGVVNGMVAEIDGIIADYAGRYPDFNAVLTGGDAPYFASKLKSKIFADPDLALKGLNIILDHNVPLPA
ncbi:MAG: type III pantothenate kinase [Taibaiella sp.]|nr:type III pantothenate kinase [Taibaiella sp.]